MTLILSDEAIGVESSRNTRVEYAMDKEPLLEKVDGGPQWVCGRKIALVNDPHSVKHWVKLECHQKSRLKVL